MTTHIHTNETTRESKLGPTDRDSSGWKREPPKHTIKGSSHAVHSCAIFYHVHKLLTRKRKASLPAAHPHFVSSDFKSKFAQRNRVGSFKLLGNLVEGQSRAFAVNMLEWIGGSWRSRLSIIGLRLRVVLMVFRSF